jgi:transposase
MSRELEQARLTIADLQDNLARRDAQVQALSDHVKDLDGQLTRARLQIDQMLKRLYGRSSEKFDPAQLLFDGLLIMTADQAAAQRDTTADEPVAPPAPKPAAGTPRRRHEHGRAPLPEHLKRVEILVEVPEEARICPVTGEPMLVIGYETSEKLAYDPGRLYVKVFKRPKLVSPARHNGHTGVIVPPMPDFPIPRCKADVTLLAGVVTAKFADHQPLYRQEAIFAREGVHLSRTTLDGWLMQLAAELAPLYPAMKLALFEDDYLGTDDTPVDLIEPGRGAVRQARLWIYLRYGDPPSPGSPPVSRGPPRYQSPVRPRLIVYDFTADRRKERPREFLGDWRGRLQADAYSGYDLIFRQDGMIELGCWSHARRGFKEALSSRPREAAEMMVRIGELYHVEDQVRGGDPATRLAARRQRAIPVLDAIFAMNTRLLGTCLPSEPLAKACGYLVNQRDAICRYTVDGRLEIDNNIVENWIRPIAVGRNNWLFMGSEAGGRANALFLSLVQSCRCNNIDPWRYLCDLFSRVMSHPAHRLRELLPDVWRPQAASVSG